MKAKKRKAPKKVARIKGPASRMSVRADTELAINLQEDEYGAVAAVKALPTDLQMTMDMFNVVHARIALSDGITEVIDASHVREKLFEVISTAGWEQTLALLASCARLFAEVSSPLPDLNKVTKEFLHTLAKNLDASRQPMRHVDRDTSPRRVR